jgi:flagellar hook-associated protein 1 FlgK
VVIAGTGAGVRLSDVQRQVDDYLLRDLRGTSATLGSLDVQDKFFQRIQDMFGTPDSNSSIGASISNFATELSAMATSPESVSQRLDVVAAAKTLANQLNTMSSNIQTLRLEADKEIAQSIDTVNEQLGIIDKLNAEIAQAKVLGQPTGDLEDKRDLALDTVSEQLDINYFTRDTGEVVVFTRSGKTLLDSEPQPLSHSAAASMAATLTYPGGITGIELAGTDITSEIESGRLGALIAMRDDTLPDMTAEIDKLATTLRDEVNRIHNEGSGLPAATTLTGSRAQTGTAASLTGPVRITLLNGDGTQAFSAVVTAPATLDAAGFAAAIDTALAGSGFTGVSASETGGVVTIDGGGYGVVLSGGTVDPGGGAATTNLSDFLHLNDFFVGGDGTEADYAGVIAVRSDIAADPALVSRGMLRQDATSGDYYIAPGDNAIAQKLADKFSEQLTFPAVGELPQTGSTLAEYATAILSQSSSEYANVLDQKDFQQALFNELNLRADAASGVNMDEELGNLILLQNAYAASARLITTASDLFDILTNLGR